MDKKKMRNNEKLLFGVQHSSRGMKNPHVEGELELIRKENGGILRAQDVVAFAKSKNTALHKHFEWSDTAAAQLWRLKQAGDIIRVAVIIDSDTQQQIRAYVSTSDLRKEHGGGYIISSEAPSNDKTILSDALRELKSFKSRFFFIKEVKPVLEVIDRVLKEHESLKPLKNKVVNF